MKVVITGGSKGIGKAIARAFAAEGASVAFCARGARELSDTASELQGINPHGTHIAFTADISEKEQLRAFCGKVKEVYGEIDILVNNAGLYRESGLLEGPEGLMEEMLEVNLLAAYRLSRFFAPGMKARGSGHIFNICSVASLRAVARAGAYTVTKHALLGLSRTLREELKPFGVKVTAVIPGSTFSASWEGTAVDTSQFVLSEDIASVMLNAYHLSPRATVEELLITPSTLPNS